MHKLSKPYTTAICDNERALIEMISSLDILFLFSSYRPSIILYDNGEIGTAFLSKISNEFRTDRRIDIFD